MSILQTFPVVADDRGAEGFDGPWRSAVHSGNIGDIIYSLPTCRMLEINHFILNLCADPAFGGRVLLERSARALVPLLLAQKFIQRVTIIKSNVPLEYATPADLGVDYILDSFRGSYSNYQLHLLYAHAVPYNLTIDGSKPWLILDQAHESPQEQCEPYIVVGLTKRYRRFEHSYYENLFRNVPADRVYFVGIENDQIERANIGGTAVRVTDFLSLAKLIANASLFIGNPSFTYALAESLKVRRFVEVPEVNNVYPLDSSGWLLHQCDIAFVRAKIFETLNLHEQADHCFADLRTTLEHAEQELTTQQIRQSELVRQLDESSRLSNDRHQYIEKLSHGYKGLSHEYEKLSHEHEKLSHEHEKLSHEHEKLLAQLNIARQNIAIIEDAFHQTKRSLTWRLIHRVRQYSVFVQVYDSTRRIVRPFTRLARKLVRSTPR